MSLLNVKSETNHQVFYDDCIKMLSSLKSEIDLTFLDPPFNQQKQYASCADDLPENDYWEMIREICSQVFQSTSKGGSDRCECRMDFIG